MAVRFAIIIFLFGGIYLVLFFNLFNLQVQKGSQYLARAEAQYRAGGIFDAPRGGIYFTDKNGSKIPVAINKDFPQVFAVPKEIVDAEEAIQALAPIASIDTDKLRTALANKKSLYTLMIPKATSSEIESIKALNLKGVYIGNEKERFYPLGSIGAQLIGFLGEKSDESGLVGLYGVEKQFNNDLTGSSGDMVGQKITFGHSGKDIELTVDRNIQAQAEEVLTNLVSKFKAEKGTVIVEDPKTGKILAMAGLPNFDPNDYSKSEIGTFLNPVTQSIYEPGSVYKVLTMAAAIDTGAVTPDTTFVDPGFVIVNGSKIMNWDHKAHGKVTMTNVIEKSLNTGMVFVEKQMDHRAFINYLKKFGVDRPTGVELPGELGGNLKSLTNVGREVNFATAAFGQGVAVTPIEMINAIAAISNKGVLMKPTILANENSKELEHVVSEETARKVVTMMVSAVDEAKVAKINGYTVAGKTGTAYVPDFKKGGYTDQVINTYIGFAPAYDPKFIVLIRIDKPVGAPLAGLSVVPAFKELAQFILNYYNIPPDRVDNPAGSN